MKYNLLDLKSKDVDFVHDQKYGDGFGDKRYDFYVPCENKYIEVTGYDTSWRHYYRYLRKIVVKKRHVENVLRANFQFIQKRLTSSEKRYVMKNLKR